jgi:rhodanese-related sulfurtransferase
MSQLESRLGEIPKDKVIVTYCMRGTRAGRAAAILESKGYKVFGSCGITEWKDKGYPTVTVQSKK